MALAALALLLGGVGWLNADGEAPKPSPQEQAAKPASAEPDLSVETWAFDATLFEGLDDGGAALSSSGGASERGLARVLVGAADSSPTAVFEDVGERSAASQTPASRGVSQQTLRAASNPSSDVLVDFISGGGGGASGGGGGAATSAISSDNPGDDDNGGDNPDNGDDPVIVPSPSAVAVGLAMLAGLALPRRRRDR